MKKWILSVAFIVAISGYASAQKQTKVTPVKKTEKSGVQKAKGTDTKPVIKKDTTSYSAKIKLVLPPVDTTGTIPKNKDN